MNVGTRVRILAADFNPAVVNRTGYVAQDNGGSIAVHLDAEYLSMDEIADALAAFEASEWCASLYPGGVFDSRIVFVDLPYLEVTSC